MISIAEILMPSCVNLDLSSSTLPAAVEEVLASLRGDPRVSDWESLRATVVSQSAPSLETDSGAITIAHGRTEVVGSLVMAAGVTKQGFDTSDSKKKVRLVLVAGIPASFNNEYLRVVGSIARFCQNPGFLQQLLSAKTPANFIQLLEEGESQV